MQAMQHQETYVQPGNDLQLCRGKQPLARPVGQQRSRAAGKIQIDVFHALCIGMEGRKGTQLPQRRARIPGTILVDVNRDHIILLCIHVIHHL